MCGRFTLTSEISALQQSFPWAEFSVPIQPRYNIAPSQPLAVISNEHPELVDFFSWGLIPSWAKDPNIGNQMINARAETLAQKPAFRSPFRYRRCLILADGFYEWKKEGTTKIPIYIRLASGLPFAFAGIWDIWQSPDGSEIRSCAIITTEPNSLIALIHNRMPVILQPKDYSEWLNPQPANPMVLQKILQPYPSEEMAAFPVSKRVNNPKEDVPECILPVEQS